jgi:hypothetical protein
LSPRHVHIHRYERTEWGKRKTPVWKCTLDDCTHYLHPEMVKNRMCLCYKCGRTFKLTLEKLARKRPTCDFCMGLVPAEVPVEKPVIQQKKKEAVPSLLDLDIRELLKDLQ